MRLRQARDGLGCLTPWRKGKKMLFLGGGMIPFFAT
jgi:hypothetical protein